MIPKKVLDLLGEVFHEWSEDKVPRLGAALAYYSIFSLVPLLVIAIGIAGLVFERNSAQQGMIREIEATAGEPAAAALQDMMKQTSENGESWPATILGLVILFFGASGVFVQLQDALNTIWKVTPRPGRALWDMLRDRILSFSVVLGTGFLLLVSLVVSATLSALNRFMTSEALPGGFYLWQGLNWLVSFGLITLLFALIYKLLPDARVAWRDAWMGGAVTALLFALGKLAIGLYLGQSSTTSAFGAAASLVVILIWVYYSSQILLLGAEFTRVYARRRGATLAPAENAVAVTPEERARQGMPRDRDVQAAAGGG